MEYAEYSHQLIIRGPEPSILGFCCYAEHKSPGVHHVAVEVIATHAELPERAQRQCFGMLITPMFNRMLRPAPRDMTPGKDAAPGSPAAVPIPQFVPCGLPPPQSTYRGAALGAKTACIDQAAGNFTSSFCNAIQCAHSLLMP